MMLLDYVDLLRYVAPQSHCTLLYYTVMYRPGDGMMLLDYVDLLRYVAPQSHCTLLYYTVM